MEASEVVAAAYGGEAPVFGREYIIPKPFDPRLILEVAPAVARAAMDSGVATPADRGFRGRLSGRSWRVFVFRSGQADAAGDGGGQAGRAARIVYGEGEDERVLRAVQTLVDDGVAEPILLGRREVIAAQGEVRWGCGWISDHTRCRCWIRRSGHAMCSIRCCRSLPAAGGAARRAGG